MSILLVRSSAILSNCGRYRYTLSRTWDESLPVIAWIMLNPSTADAHQDDQTIRRCLGFAESWGAGGIVVVNLFALRATDPQVLIANGKAGKDVIGPENDAVIERETAGRQVVAGWGANGFLQQRDSQVLSLLRRAERQMECLGVTKLGKQPRHPLYVAAHTPLVPFRAEVTSA